jgi:dihydrofolate reductase
MTSKLLVSASLSVDGVMQSPAAPDEDASNGFQYGGWLVPHLDEGFTQIVGNIFTHVNSMLLGRRSYDILAAYWPHVPDQDGAEQINSMRKYVATRTPMNAEWRNTEVLVGDAAETVADLKQRTDGGILVQGSSDLLRTLQAAELIDEYHLLIFPVVLGRGKRLFSDGATAAGLKLTGSSRTDAGVVYAAYERAGKPPSGRIA